MKLISMVCLLGMTIAADDRKVAEWTVFMGGRVLPSGSKAYTNSVPLPAGELQLLGVDWVGMNVDPPDLARLAELKHLREVHLPGPIWNRNADGGKDGSAQLREQCVQLTGVLDLEPLASRVYIQQWSLVSDLVADCWGWWWCHCRQGLC